LGCFFVLKLDLFAGCVHRRTPKHAKARQSTPKQTEAKARTPVEPEEKLFYFGSLWFKLIFCLKA
jgi:hypothetical protein